MENINNVSLKGTQRLISTWNNDPSVERRITVPAERQSTTKESGFGRPTAN